MAELPYYLIDLPEFGTLADWQEALADLSNEPATPQVVEAIERCREAIAELEGKPVSSMKERWLDHGLVIGEKD